VARPKRRSNAFSVLQLDYPGDGSCRSSKTDKIPGQLFDEKSPGDDGVAKRDVNLSQIDRTPGTNRRVRESKSRCPAAFQAAVKPVWDGYIAQNGDAVVNAVLATQK
jgi:hypothetical protein